MKPAEKVKVTHYLPPAVLLAARHRAMDQHRSLSAVIEELLTRWAKDRSKPAEEEQGA